MRKLPMMLTAATMLSAAALPIGTAQAAPAAPAGVAIGAQSTQAIQQVGWGYRRWHHRYWGWRRPYWGWHHRYWRHRGW